jgi:vancomycin permeability regulator SanA
VTKRNWGRLLALGVGSGVAGLGGLLVLGLAVRLLSRDRIVGADELPDADVALVLGAEVYADGVPSRFLRARLDLAAELYRRGRVRRVLASGDGSSPYYDETAGMHDYLREAGVAEDDLLIDPAGFDTYDSCLRARDVFGLTRLVLVSQSYHLPRALAICRALGIDAWGVGDESARSSPRVWSHGSRREFAANLKLVWDVLSRRPPRASVSSSLSPSPSPSQAVS